MKRKTTIRDIAELVGVHHSTVSRALSPSRRDKISPAVVKQVEKAAKKLGYFPNIAASSLKQNRSFALGVLIPDLTNPIFPPIIRGIQDTAGQSGYTVITANTDDETDKELSALKMMMGRSIDGVIIATARRDDPVVDECIANDIPFVLVNRTVDKEGINAVIVDEDFGMRSVVDHLTDLGHSSIACVAGPAQTSTGQRRADVFRDCLRIRGLPHSLVRHARKFTIDEGRAVMNAFLDDKEAFTAVACGNDLLALGCIDALQTAGRRVPDDVSVTGYDDMQFLERMNPALTTVCVPKYEMGVQATKALFDVAAGQDRDAVVLKMQPRLIVRESTVATPGQTAVGGN